MGPSTRTEVENPLVPSPKWRNTEEISTPAHNQSTRTDNHRTAAVAAVMPTPVVPAMPRGPVHSTTMLGL